MLLHYHCGHSVRFNAPDYLKNETLASPTLCPLCEQQSTMLGCAVCGRPHPPDETIITLAGAAGKNCLQEQGQKCQTKS